MQSTKTTLVSNSMWSCEVHNPLVHLKMVLARNFFRYSLKALLFVILVVVYYVLYMQWAIEQYNEKRTTMAESIKHANKLDYPIFVFCPEPGFKPSFFEKMKWNTQPGIEKLVWKYPMYRKVFQNVSSVPDLYDNMSFALGVDWEIVLIPVSQLGIR